MKDNPNKKIHQKAKAKPTKTLAQRLMTKPVADRGDEIPHFTTDIQDNHHHQVDLLYLPVDNKSKYALVVADVGSRLINAEPLTARDSHAVVEAIAKIYKRGILKTPNIITSDQGSEFKAKFKTYCDDNEIFLKYAKPHRHRQVAIVERANGRIAKQLFERMIGEEMLTKKKSTQWVAVLKATVEKLNKLTKKRL